MSHRRILVLAAALVVAAAGTAGAGGGGGVVVSGAPCATPCGHPAPCGVQYVQRTILVPTYVTETRLVNCTEYEQQKRTRTYQVHHRIPETKQVEQKYTVYEAQTHTKDVVYNVQVPVTKTVEQKYNVRVPVWKNVVKDVTVMVPHQEQRSGVRKVWQTIQVEQTRTVCRDLGHWEVRSVPVCVGRHHHGCGCRPCGRCGGCGRGHCSQPVVCMVSQRCWVPNIVQEQVPVTVNKCVLVNQPYEYMVTVHKPETQQRTYRMCEYKVETHTRNVQYCSYETQQRTRQVTHTTHVPKPQTRMVNVTTYRTEVETKTQDYMVSVPITVQKEIHVQVCRMVPQVVTVPVGGGCGHGHRRGRRCRRCGC